MLVQPWILHKMEKLLLSQKQWYPLASVSMSGVATLYGSSVWCDAALWCIHKHCAHLPPSAALPDRVSCCCTTLCHTTTHWLVKRCRPRTAASNAATPLRVQHCSMHALHNSTAAHNCTSCTCQLVRSCRSLRRKCHILLYVQHCFMHAHTAAQRHTAATRCTVSLSGPAGPLPAPPVPPPCVYASAHHECHHPH